MASEGGRRFARLLPIVAIALATVRTASAEPTAAEKERARDLMAEGRELRDANNLANALKAFEGADAIMHVPTTGYEVARTQQALGLLVEARETALTVSRIPPTPGDPPPFVEARAKVDALLRELATQIPTIKVTVSINDPSVTPTVTLDNQAVAPSEGPLRVNPGRHLLVARARGATETMATVSLGAGETKEVALQLEISADRPPPPAPTSTTTTTPVPLVSWVAFGAAAAGLAVGSVAGIVALSEESDIAGRCSGTRCPRQVESDLDSARTTATVSTVGFVLAGVAAAVGVVGIIAGRSSSRAPSATTADLRLRANGVAVRF
jgi:hypothetical protein